MIVQVDLLKRMVEGHLGGVVTGLPGCNLIVIASAGKTADRGMFRLGFIAVVPQ